MKIAFLAPRFHSNQIKLVEYLIDNNNFVKFYVTNVGKSEDHSILKPSIINLNYLFSKFRKIVNHNNKDALFDYKYGLPSIKELLEYRKNNFDVIIIRYSSNFLVLSYALVSKVFGTKIVFYTQHEIYGEQRPIKDTFYKILIKVFNAKWISPCFGDARYNKRLKELYYVPFCMDVADYEKQWFIDDYINIICIGKFVKRKNHQLLIEALIPLASKYKFNLTLIGEVSEMTGYEYYNNILDFSKNLPFSISIITNMNREDVFEKYKKSDIFVLPASNEPASVSNLEAMSFGLPIITSDTNMTSTYTQENGFVFLSNSEVDLNLKLEKLLSNRKKIIQMGNKSLEVVKRNHDSNIVYKYLLKKILNN